VTRRLAAAAVLLALWAWGVAAASPDWSSLDLTPYAPPKPAPDFVLPDLEGGTRALADARGQVLLLFFWTTW
jgi:hypothetical protein